MSESICPGCDGPKSKRAKLCRKCRTKANAVGASVVTQIHDVTLPAATRPRLRTPEQNRVYHGMLNDLAKFEHKSLRTVKRETLAEASRRFGRKVESSTELSELEMASLIEGYIDRRLEPYELAAAETAGAGAAT